MDIGVRGSDFLLMFWLFLGFFLMMFFASIGLPMIGQAAYFTSIFIGIFGTEAFLRIWTSKYAYLEMLIRPSNKKLHLFIDEVIPRKVGEHTYAEKLILGFPIRYEDFGKVKQVMIYHKYPWSKRVRFRSGYAVYTGQLVSHPQTETIEVYQMPGATLGIDHGEVIPCFWLRSASQDANIEALRSGGPVTLESTMDSSSAEVQTLRAQLAHAKQLAAEWQQKALAYEAIVEQQKNEIRALSEKEDNLKNAAVEYLLPITEGQGDVEGALKHIRGEGAVLPGFSKWLIPTVAIVGILGVMVLRPDLKERVVEFVSTPGGMLVAGIIIVAMILVVIYLWRRR